MLIVDDSGPSRSFAVRQARAVGHHVVEASSGHEALLAFGREHFDIVVLDVQMPELDGFETCRLIRTMAGGAELPVVFMTGLDDPSTIESAIAVGADDILIKPFRGGELELRTRALLRTYTTLRNERAAREELERLAAQKDALAEFLVHDLKSPLASVAFTLHDLIDDPAAEACLPSLRSCLSATDTASRMVMNLLDLSGAVRLEAHPTACSVEALLAHVRDRFAVRLEIRGTALVTRTTAPTMWADNDLLRRIAENLVDNALRYAPSGSRVDVEVEPHDGGAMLTITDRGPGVPIAHRERVFDRFVQLDPHASHRASRGLGLAFCRVAVEAHGGRIWVEDAPGGGARFRSFFPEARC